MVSEDTLFPPSRSWQARGREGRLNDPTNKCKTEIMVSALKGSPGRRHALSLRSSSCGSGHFSCSFPDNDSMTLLQLTPRCHSLPRPGPCQASVLQVFSSLAQGTTSGALRVLARSPVSAPCRFCRWHPRGRRPAGYGAPANPAATASAVWPQWAWTPLSLSCSVLL